MVRSEIIMVGENPTLAINGVPVAENAYITYFRKKACYGDFAKAGYKLYSVPLYFATRGITEYNHIPPFDDGIFEGDEPDYSIIDSAFREILDECPDAYIFPRVNMALPEKWERENPDELCDIGNLDMNKRRFCYSSDKWAEETKRLLGLFIDHIENSPYRDHVIAYQLADGNTEEWFGFDLRGSIGKRSREKFEEYKYRCGIEGTEEEYYGFLNEIAALRIIEFSDFAKERTGGRVLIGSFYGYTFECPNRTSNHHALRYVLESKSVDFLCSPISYINLRETGRDAPCMLPLESLKQHGKLYFLESDARTHLTLPLFDVPHFDNPHYKPRDLFHSVETLKMYYARSLIKAHAIWWFDMGGGWYRYPRYMEMMRDFIGITESAMKKDTSSVSEVAVIVDERSLDGFDSEELNKISKPIVSNIRYQLGLMGAPYDAYLADDYERIKEKYKAFILLVPKPTALMKKIAAESEGCLIINSETSDITTDELRGYLRDRGVHIYSDKDAVIYANRSYLFLHTASIGEANIKMPDGLHLKEIYGDPIDVTKDVLPARCSYLFEIVGEND